MKILSAANIRKWEQSSIDKEGIAPAELMERAANALFHALQESIGLQLLDFHILCGFGNNGGDGLALGRMLQHAGHSVTIHLLEHTTYSVENKINQERLRQTGTPIYPLTTASELHIAKDSILIDALFGYGLSRPLDDNWHKLISQINNSTNTVIAVDIPSGLSADQPTALDAPIVKAAITYTFACPKLSLLLPNYADFTGDFHVLDIGLKEDIINHIPTAYTYTTKESIQSIIPPLPKFSHKGTFGHSYLIGGQYGSIGATVLAARAALRSGCGLVTCFVPSCGYSILQTAFPEAQVQTTTHQHHIDEFPQNMAKFDAIGIGMGMGTHADTEEAFLNLIKRFKSETQTPALLLDADSINILAKHPEWQTLLPSNSILTPHPKELERLIGSWTDDFQKLSKVKEWACRLQQILIVKGANTAVVLPDGHIHFNSTGNPGMATGGSGDVLSGIITSLLAQGYTPKDAALVGVYLHGLAGDLAAKSIHKKSIIASDIIDHLSDAWRFLQNS